MGFPIKQDRIKLDKDSALIISIVDEKTDSKGNITGTIQKCRMEEDISLGSIKKPFNENILTFEWIDTSKKIKPWFRDFLNDEQ